MWVCQPRAIRCRIDENRHTVAVMKFIQGIGQEMDIRKLVRSCIGETKREALRLQMELVTNYILSLKSGRFDTLLVTDFELDYYIQECTNNTFWSGAHAASTISMSEIV